MQRSFLKRLGAGLNLFLKTPRLRGLVALSLATASGGAMVFVNTVVLVQTKFGMGEQATAIALSAFGFGSIAAALCLVFARALENSGGSPHRVGRRYDYGGVACRRFVGCDELPGAVDAMVGVRRVLFADVDATPVGRVLRRSSHAEDRTALFAAQFALSHACWLVAYPVAGVASATYGTGAAFLILALLCAAGVIGLFLFWPADDPARIVHAHDDLPANHPHLQGDGEQHVHVYLIDDLHERWPRAS